MSMAKHLIIFLKNTLCQHNQYIQEFESQNWMYIIPIIWNNSNWQWNSIALASFLEGLLVDKFRGRLFLQFKLIFMICFQFFLCLWINFDVLISNMIFKKWKKNDFHAFLSEKHFEKQPAPHSQTLNQKCCCAPLLIWATWTLHLVLSLLKPLLVRYVIT
jgi:hypothetical protein